VTLTSSADLLSTRPGLWNRLNMHKMKSVQRLVTRMVGAQARFTFSDLIGEDPTFLERIDISRRVARSDSTVASGR